MTPAEITRQKVRAIISAEANDYGEENLTPNTQLKGDLYLDSSRRIAIACELEKEFGTLDEAAWKAITDIRSTVEAVCLAVIRNTTKEKA